MSYSFLQLCEEPRIMSKPLILVTNDDGITAPGIRNLVEAVSSLGEVIVVAPDQPQSGQGHAITIEQPIKLHKVDVFDGIQSYRCSGTPVDCVKLAKNVLLKDRHIDLCVSGINHGSNSSINIIYSGTMSAAMEASLEGIDSIGFSLCDYGFDADFSAAKYYAHKISSKVLERPFGACQLINVNIPKGSFEEIKGIKICRQAKGRWIEEFQESEDPRGQKYYWLTGRFVNDDEGEDNDQNALKNGYISIVPAHHDLTHYPSIPQLKHLEDVS